jgi:Fic family protein
MLLCLDIIFKKPSFTAKELGEMSKISSPAINNTLKKFVELGILKEVTGYKRNRSYKLWQFIELFR